MTTTCCDNPSPTCGCQTGNHGGKFPVAVIGAGPIGLVAALHLLAKGEIPLILEAGAKVGDSIRQWQHVRLFSPWKYLVDETTREALSSSGWSMPDEDSLPAGREVVEMLLEPIASLPAVSPHLHLGHRVIAVTRRGMDKVKTTGRDKAPFELLVQTTDGSTSRIYARAVIDASGTWQSPNPMGAGGVPADGESSAGEIVYGIPDVLGPQRSRYGGKHVLVVGSGHSAFNALLDLVTLKADVPSTRITWAVRRNDPGSMFGGGENDALEARGALGARLRALISAGAVGLRTGVRIAGVRRTAAGLMVETSEGTRIGPVDEIIVTTGFRPDLHIARELRLELDPWLEAPVRLAPLIDPNVHSCGTVYPHGAAELSHPEKDYYVVGMKSYGRAPTFLLLTGYEQVRSVVCALVGDEDGARNVALSLPETGVCQTGSADSSCCGTHESGPVLAQLSHR